MGLGDRLTVLNPPTRSLERVFGDGKVFVDGVQYPVIITRVAKAPTITSVTTTDANWTALITSQTKIVQWRICELNGNDIHYAFTASPGDNFSVAFGWVSQATSPAAIYIKRPGNDNITVKLEYWLMD